MNVSDFIFEYLYRNGIDTGFTVTGGGAMFLNEAHRTSNVRSIHHHHEQAAAMAAVGYTKASDRPSLVVATTGCGSSNTVTGLLDAYQDSVPVFFLSGNVNRSQMTYFHPQYIGMRKWGMQESNTMAMVSSMVKRGRAIHDAEDIGWIMAELVGAMTDGRPGPVWLDVPMDVQNHVLSDEYCEEWLNTPPKKDKPVESKNEYYKFDEVWDAIEKSERPLLIVGNGARGCTDELLAMRLPMVFTYLSVDIVPSDDYFHIGRVGPKGDRAGNFAMQNCDLLISIGCSLTTPVTGYNLDAWAPEARLIVLDIEDSQHRYLIDHGKLDKDDFIWGDVKTFCDYIVHTKIDPPNYKPCRSRQDWCGKLQEWKAKWDVYKEPHDTPDAGTVNIYSFLENLNKVADSHDNAIVVTDTGTGYYATAQAFKFKENQTYVTTAAQADMGFTLPAAIGASVSDPERVVFAISGDGSFQMNLQELQTLKHLNLPIKLFILNNNGYLSMRNTIDKFFNSNYIGTDDRCGVSFPDMSKIAYAYDLPYIAYKDDNGDEALQEALDTDGPCIVEVFCMPKQAVMPSLASMKNADGTVSSQPLHNMFPFMSDEELQNELFIYKQEKV